MKKKLLFLLPAVAMILAGCGNGGGETTDTPTSGDAPTSTPAPTSTTPVVKSDMQIAYEAGLAVHSGDETRDEYTFSGVVTAVIGNSFFVQKGDYGMYVYNKPTENLAVGKTVSVTAKIKNYNGLVETGTTSASAVTGDGELPTAAAVSSLATLSAINPNILCNGSAVLKSVDTAYVPTSTAGLYTFTFGEDDITIKVDKYVAHDTVATLLVEDNIGETFNFTGLVSTVYQENMQLLFASSTAVEMTPRAITGLAIKTAPTLISYFVGDTFVPTGLVITVTYEDGATKDVAYADHAADFTFTPSGALTTENNKVTIGYKGSSVDQAITVVNDTLLSIAISGDMTKKTYGAENEEWDPAGLVATGTYENTGEHDISASVEWSYSVEHPVAGTTAINVTASLGTVNSPVKAVSGLTVKSSMQFTYEVAAALATGKNTGSAKYTFTGVVSSFYGNSFNVQNGAYGMYVYSSKSISGVAVGKEVRVNSALANYKNMLETNGTPTVTVLGDGVSPTPVNVTTKAQLEDLNQNVVLNVTAKFKSEDTAWSGSANGFYTFLIGSDEVTIKFDKYSYDATKYNVFKEAAVNDEFDISLVATTKFNDTVQIQFGKTSTIAVHA